MKLKVISAFVVATLFSLPICVSTITAAETEKEIVLFAADFEQARPGALINAEVGLWMAQGRLGAKIVDKEGAKTDSSHDASKQWALMDRADNGRAQAWFNEKYPEAELADKIVARFATYCDSETKQITREYSAYSFGIGTTLAGVMNVQACRGGSGTFWAMNNGQVLDTKVPYKAKTWQQWELTLEPTNGTYHFSVDGVASPTLKLGKNFTDSNERIVLMEIEPGIYGAKQEIKAKLYVDDLSVVGVFSERALMKQELRQELIAEMGEVQDPYNEAGEALNVGNRLQLFLDSSSYADRWDVRAVPNMPIKSPSNPVVEPDQLWEHSVGLPNVLFDKETHTFHMWYANYDTGAWGGSRRKSKTRRTPYMMSYAYSKDGTHWTKPLLDKVPYMGYEKTNIVMLGNKTVQEFRVIHTPQHLREQGKDKFMLWYRDAWPGYSKSVGVAYSDNGIDWEEHEHNPVYANKALDAQHCPIYVEEKGYWLLYGRPMPLAANESRYHGENIRTRIGVAMSRDMQTWTPMRHCLAPDDMDLPKQDPAEVDRHRDPDNGGFFFDRMAAIRYGNQFLGFLAIQPRRGSGRGWIEMATSSDGFRWHRAPDRMPLISFGEGTDWDAGHVWMLSDVVEAGPWLYLYYTGSSQTWRTRYPDSMRAIGMAKVRRERFIGQYAGYKGGWLLSREVEVTGDRLLVNISPQHRAFSMKSHGKVQVELCDRNSRTAGHLAGFGQDDCPQLRADDYEQVVRWKKTGEDLSSLKGSKIMIRFWMQNAYLFGFRFANAEDLDKVNETSW